MKTISRFRKVVTKFLLLAVAIISMGGLTSKLSFAQMNGNGFKNTPSLGLQEQRDNVSSFHVHKVYNNLAYSLGEDVFMNKGNFSKVMNLLNLNIKFQDEDGDGIADIFQNSTQFNQMFQGINFVDENNDGICDLFQTEEVYGLLQQNNFIDEDGDGLCDNYKNAINFNGNFYANYQNYEVDLSEDIFQNRMKFMSVVGNKYNFIDENEDGICDIFQNSDYFKTTLPDIEFVDENNDGIYDGFQTADFYRAFGMKNFIDLDGDGICDNYQN